MTDTLTAKVQRWTRATWFLARSAITNRRRLARLAVGAVQVQWLRLRAQAEVRFALESLLRGLADALKARDVKLAGRIVQTWAGMVRVELRAARQAR